ncbi:MAG: glycosyltransferase family 2 protein [Ruminococcus sp.]
MIKVSVIVPAYNVEQYLERCLSSLAAQTLSELEIIVINDGSTDGTGETVRRLIKEYPEKIIVKTTKNQGAAAARNEGLALAKGEFIGFVDGDDTVYPSMFERMYRTARQTGADIVCCGYQRMDGADVQNRGIDAAVCGLYGKSIYQEPEILINSTPYLWNKIFRRSMLEKRRIVFQNLRIYEDLVFTYQSFLYAENIQYVPFPLYRYVVSRKGALTSRFSGKRFDLFRAFDCLLECYDGEGAKERFLDELFFILIKHVYVACEENTGVGTWREKFRFINRSHEYLRQVYPQLGNYTRYYKVYGNKKSKYERKSYWYFRTIFPWIPEMRRKLGKIKRAAGLGKREVSCWNPALPEASERGTISLLLFWDAVRSPEEYGTVIRLAESLQQENVSSLFTYEKERILGCPEIVEKISGMISCRERVHPFLCLGTAGKILMAVMESSPWLYSLLGRWMDKKMKREFLRLFPEEGMVCALVVGEERPRNLALIKSAGLKVIYCSGDEEKSVEEVKQNILLLVK